MSNRLSDWEIMSASGIGAACAVLFTNPLEVAKTRLQMQNELVKGKQKVYRNGFDCMLKTWKMEGVAGVQRGLGLAVVRDGSKCFFRLGLYEPILKRWHDSSKGQAPFHLQLLAGATSGTVAALICNPLDMIKVRIQSSGGLATNHHNISNLSTLKVFSKVYTEEGILGFWKGLKINVLRSITFTSVALSVNSRVKNALSESFNVKDGVFRDIGGSLIGSAIAIVFMNPVDVVRTRLYNQPSDPKNRIYSGTLDGFVKIARKEGILAFWKGGFAHYCRVGPHTVLSFVFIGRIKRELESSKNLDRCKREPV